MVYTCELCEANYESLKGLRIHQSSCRKRFIRNNLVTTPLADGQVNASDAQIETADILLADEFGIDRIPEVVPNLPNYPENTKSRFSYHDIPGETFANLINDLYNEIVTWKKILFKLPTGNAAKAFMKEFSLWFERFNLKTEHHSITLKVYIILPAVMLQKRVSHKNIVKYQRIDQLLGRIAGSMN